MSGRKRARRLEATAGSSKGYPTSSAVVGGCALLLAASVSNCGFPEYDFHPDAAGAVGLGGNPSGGGGAASGSSGDSGGPVAGGGMAGGDGGAAEAGAAGGGCVYPAPLIYPDHCFDKTLADGETGTDCGGGECSACATAQTCASNADCLSGKCSAAKTCVQVFAVQYASIVGDAFVRAPKFKLTLDYSDPRSTTLDQIRIRYYFNHNAVTEPVLGLNPQATIDPGNSQHDIDAAQIRPLVHRTVLGPAAPNNGRKTDSYLEIGFTSPSTVASGTRLEITQDFWTGSTDALFDQASHYSFFNGSSANETITVYREGKRVWGIEPPLVELPDCAYAAGVNLNGGALEVSGEQLQGEGDAQLTYVGGGAYANPVAKALPLSDTTTTALLTTARTLSGSGTATWAVPNGKYLAYAWLTSASSADSGVLSIQDNTADKFYGTQQMSAAAWALVGPYPIIVNEQKLVLAATTGIVHVAGLKLYQAE